MAPVLIPFLVSVGSLVVAGVGIGAAIGTAAAITALGYIGQRLLSQRRRTALTLDERSTSQIIPTTPRRIIYGRCRIAANVVFAGNSGSTVNAVYALADHPLDTVRKLYVDGVLWQTYSTAQSRFPLTDEGDISLTYITRNAFAEGSAAFLRIDAAQLDGTPTVMIYGYDLTAGSGEETVTPLVRNINAPGTMHFAGMSVFAARFRTRTWSSLPNLEFEVSRGFEGLRVPDGIDPAWSPANTALCLYDYLTRYTNYGRTVFGDKLIDEASVLEAAAICHARGWQANGVINLSDTPASVIQELTMAMGAGAVVEEGGVLRFIAGAGLGAEAPLALHTGEDADINYEIGGGTPLDSRPGAIEINYAALDGTRNSVIAGEDTLGVQGIDTLESVFIQTPEQAQFAADVFYQRRTSNRSIAITYYLTPQSPSWLHSLRVFDLISLPRVPSRPAGEVIGGVENPVDRYQIQGITITGAGQRQITAARI